MGCSGWRVSSKDVGRPLKGNVEGMYEAWKGLVLYNSDLLPAFALYFLY